MSNDIKTIKSILTVFISIVGIYILYIFSGLLIPLLLALFMAILLQPALAWFQKKKWPFGLSLTVISLSSISVLSFFGWLIYNTASQIMMAKNELVTQVADKFHGLLNWFNLKTNLGINSEEAINFLLQSFSLNNIVQSTGVILGNFTNTFFMTILYFIVFIGGILKYEQFISYLEEGRNDGGKILKGFEEIKKSIVTYIKVKVIVSFFTGLFFGIVSWLFGLDFYIFWGFLAFALNFIPTFGSIIATIPPLLLGLIQLQFPELIFLFVCLMTIQVFFGNILEPRLLGASLSLNTITVLVGLVFWGFLWGIVGMILSVPLLVLMKVILSQMPEAKIIVKLMGSTPPDDAEKSDFLKKAEEMVEKPTS
jgi:AI-2 transport protein TqsA